ncbi:hypothetical protein DOJK_01181 [Patescibacteria group bacterium]|nr:hypothetical protein DOJK_01181 [Patescibacteria group bacterium]
MSLTLCAGGDCPLRHGCLRHTKEIFGKQDFFAYIPYNTELAQCDYYYDESPSEQAIQQLAYQLWQAEGCPDDRALSYWLRATQQLILKQRQMG